MAKNFMASNPIDGTKKESAMKEENTSNATTTKENKPSKAKQGRPKTKQGTYKKVNIAIEEKLLETLKDKATMQYGGNLTLLINSVLSEYVEK